MAKQMKSIIQENMDECFVCGTTNALHVHHIYYGRKNRDNSTKYHCICRLCWSHHEGVTGVHHNKNFDDQLKQVTQMAFEKIYSHEEFMRVFGKNYL